MRKAVLAGIIILAFLLRVPLIDKYPVGFTPDEASFGYDAYSILHTGKDQWGHTLPLVLESFGDFKAPIYTYLDIPFVAVFGLNTFSTRLPNAIIGTLAVLVVYLLIKELCINSSKHSLLTTHNSRLGLIAALLLAINPWHIMLSRGAFEANLTTFFMPLGVLFFLKGFKNPKYLLWSSLVFGLNLFTYHSPKVITPLLIAVLVIFYFKQLFKLDKKILISAFVIFSLFSLLTLYTLTEGAGRRAADVGIFNGALEAQADMRLKALNSGTSPVLVKIVYNKFTTTAIRFYYNYKQYFSPKFLFSEGAGETTYGMLPGIPVVYRFELFSLTAFLILLWKNRTNKILWLILIWVLLAPIPPGLTMGVGYAGNRAAGMMPALQIASAFGVIYILSLLHAEHSLKVKLLAGLGLVFIILFSLTGFMKSYFLNSHFVAAKGMLYGNLDVATWLKEKSADNLKIIVSKKLSEPHIYIAFANVWNPVYYQNQTQDWNRYKEEKLVFLDQLYRYYLGKYVFQSITADDLHEDQTTLLVGRPEEFPTDINIFQKFYYPNGDPAIYIVKPFGPLYAANNQ